jgi:hypothetical protein
VAEPKLGDSLLSFLEAEISSPGSFEQAASNATRVDSNKVFFIVQPLPRSGSWQCSGKLNGVSGKGVGFNELEWRGFYGKKRDQ